MPGAPGNSSNWNARRTGLRWKEQGLQRDDTPAPHAQHCEEIKSNGYPENPKNAGGWGKEGNKEGDREASAYTKVGGSIFLPKAQKCLEFTGKAKRKKKDKGLERQVSHQEHWLLL